MELKIGINCEKVDTKCSEVGDFSFLYLKIYNLESCFVHYLQPVLNVKLIY